MPLRNPIYAGLAAQKLRKHFRSLGESGALVVSMVLYPGAGPWNAPTTADEMVPGLTGVCARPAEAVDPDAACTEDVPALVLGLLVPASPNRTEWTAWLLLCSTTAAATSFSLGLAN